MLTTILTSGVVTILINVSLKGGVTHFFNKRIAKFKTELEILTEEKRLEFQRKIYDFEIYTNKRHDVYPVIHEKFIDCANKLIFIFRLYNLDDTFFDIELVKTMDSSDFEKIKNSISEDSIPQELLHEYRINTIKELMVESSEKVEETFDFIRSSELYISDKLLTRCRETINGLMNIHHILSVKIYGESSGHEFLKKYINIEDNKLNKDIDNIFKEIDDSKVIMKRLREKINSKINCCENGNDCSIRLSSKVLTFLWKSIIIFAYYVGIEARY